MPEYESMHDLGGIGRPELAERWWRAQRIAWGASVLVLVAALAGVFGHGPLSRARAHTADGVIRLRYERFVRFQSPTRLELQIDPAAADSQGVLHLWISGEYLRRAQRLYLIPAPDAACAGEDRIMYDLRIEPGAPAALSIHLDVQEVGTLRGVIGYVPGRGATEAATSVAFSQFAYP